MAYLRRRYDGVYYQSRHASNLENWAMFEPFELESVETMALTAEEESFQEALRLLNLRLDLSL